MIRPAVTDTDSAAPVLAVADLSKSYRRGFLGRRGRPAIEDVSFTVRAGEIFALLGHNGAGKTTTLKAILDLVRPDRGSVTIAGIDASRPAARAHVGYLPESPYFHENLTARELLDFYGRLLGLDRAQRRVRSSECLERVGMADSADRRLRDCSKGMRQRVGLAQALLGRPRLLILDEPQSGLDPLGRRQVRDLLLAEKARGTTIIFSSHIVPDVEAVADRVAMLREGRLDEIKDLHAGPPALAFRVSIEDLNAAEQLELAAAHDWSEVAPGRYTIDVDGVAALAELLTACARHGVAVRDVQAVRGDLEADFLRRLVDRCEEEVVAC